jgi:hypothetical protein
VRTPIHKNDTKNLFGWSDPAVFDEQGNVIRSLPLANSRCGIPLWFIAIGIIVLILLPLGGGILLVRFGVSDILRQHNALTNWKSVQATVICAKSGPLKKPPLEFDGHIPRPNPEGAVSEDHGVWVSYRYVVDGKEYASGISEPVSQPGWDAFIGGKTVHISPPPPPPDAPWENPGDKWTGQVGVLDKAPTGPEAWARTTIARFVPGNPCEAYFDPSNPSQSFLLKEYSFSPYVCTLSGLFFSLIGCYFAGFIFSKVYAPTNSATPIWLIRLGLVACMLYSAVSGWVLLHYWIHADHPLARGTAPLSFSFSVGLIGLGFCSLTCIRLARTERECTMTAEKAR